MSGFREPSIKGRSDFLRYRLAPSRDRGWMTGKLSGVRAAAKALGGSAEREVVGVKKRVLSAAGRAAIIEGAKKRWAKVRKQAKKVAG